MIWLMNFPWTHAAADARLLSHFGKKSLRTRYCKYQQASLSFFFIAIQWTLIN